MVLRRVSSMSLFCHVLSCMSCSVIGDAVPCGDGHRLLARFTVFHFWCVFFVVGTLVAKG